jgi:YD repeat-containing protein
MRCQDVIGYTTRLTATWVNRSLVTKRKGGGLRIKRITNSDDIGLPVIKRFLYDQDTTCTGRLLTPVAYSYNVNAANATVYTNEDCVSTCSFEATYLSRSSSAINCDGLNRNGLIGYGMVTELSGEGGENGRTEYYFHNEPNTYSGQPSVPFNQDALNGKVTMIKIYDANNDLKKKVEYEYGGNTLANGILGIKLMNVPYALTNFQIQYYTNVGEWIWPSQVTETEYSGPDSLTSVKSYDRADFFHKQITKEERFLSNGDTRTIKYKYPSDFQSVETPNQYNDMVARNILNPIVEQSTYKNDLTLLEDKKINYQLWNGNSFAAPETVESSIFSNPLESRVQFNNYDARGNLLEQQKTSDLKEVYLWGYNGQYPVAQILNTTYAIASGYIMQSILDNPPDDAALRTHLNNLRNIPKALVSTYTYKPLVGITSATNPQGYTTYYEYDGLARLKRIRDQDYNILKSYEYQYQATSGCGGSCYSIAMQTMAGSNTLGYPVGVFGVRGNLLGNASGASQYISLWNADTADARIGTIAAGKDSLHFNITLNSGQTLPAGVTGCRYYQWDLAWNVLDGILGGAGAFVDFGDGTRVKLPKTATDTIGFGPHTTLVSGYYTVHTYSDTSLKTITIYHNDSVEAIGLDNAFNPATSLSKVRHLRGNFPQYVRDSKFSSMQQASALTFDSIYNWNSISTLSILQLADGDGAATPCEHLNFSQDFMKNNRGLTTLSMSGGGYYTAGVRDTTFKLTRLKSDWNTYFTSLQSLGISDDHWNREDLSALTSLNQFVLAATTTDHTNTVGTSPIPIPSGVLDNVLIQIAAGAGQSVSNGEIFLATGGTNRTTASDAAVSQLQAKGWQIHIYW